MGMKVIVYHTSYGCDTGCCGHTVKVTDDNGEDVDEEFYFDHPWYKDPGTYKVLETDREYAERLLREAFSEEHIRDLDWENCFIARD
jgi:hypothetical protein